MNLADDLTHLDCGDVFDDPIARKHAARDTSLFEVVPQVVVAPRNGGDVQKLVRYATEHKGVSLTARSGGTGMDGGALSSSVVLDFSKHMHRVGPFAEGEGRVEPGAWYRDFEKESLRRNLLMPSYPASREICAVGGMVGNNAGGELTLRYGKTADYVESLSVVLADGNTYELKKLSKDELDTKLGIAGFEGDIYRNMYKLVTEHADVIAESRPQVTKNSAGYALWDVYDKEQETFDLTRLFAGSQGTLGITTDITFRLIHPAQYSQMVVVFLDDLANLPQFVKTTLKHNPTTFESYDDKTLKLALTFFVEFIKRLGIRKSISIAFNNIAAGISLLTHGLPKLVIQITFDGDTPEQLISQAQELAHDLTRFKPRFVRITQSKAELDEYWLIRRESFNLLRTKVRGKSTAPFIDDIVVPTQSLGSFLPRLNAILDDYKDIMVHNIAGHVGNGNFHIIPLMDLSNPRARKAIPEIMHRVYNLVIDYDGSITGEHNDGIIRTPFVRQQFGDKMYKLFEQTKKIFDPHNIFNPGKKVGGTLHDAMVKMKKG